MIRITRSVLLAGTAMAFLAGCDSTGSSNQAPPSELLPTAHGPGGYQGAVGQPLVDSIGVVVYDAQGNELAGVAVTFSAGAGSGSVSPTVVVSGADGVAKTRWTLGTAAGDQAVIATAGGATYRFDAHVTPGPAALVSVAPTATSLVLGERKPLVATVTDSYGNPVTATVTWSSSAPGVATAANGSVQGNGSGTAQITATVAGVGSASATVTVTRPTLQSLSTGSHNYGMCALDAAGTAFCWGGSSASQTSFGPRPVLIPGGQHFTRVSTNGALACGLTATGQAYCWGTLGTNEGGLVTSASPQAVGGTRTFSDFSVGSSYEGSPLSSYPTNCGISGGALYCWQNRNGVIPDAAQPMATGTSFTALTAGSAHTCALAADGVPWCWMLDTDLQLGRPYNTCSGGNQIWNCLTPAPIASGQTFASVRAGGNETCGRDTGGTVYCWGYANDNVLTQAQPVQCRLRPVQFRYDAQCTATPTQIQTTPALATVVPGWESMCGLTAAGAAYCWGGNAYGQLGNGTTATSTTPVAVAGGRTFATLASGEGFYCGIDTAGQVWCWGKNVNGQLGNGTTTNSSVPTAVF